METIDLFHELSHQCSKAATEKYSTSFSSAINFLHKDHRTPVHNIYGFVRFTDEIVDTFHQYNKIELPVYNVLTNLGVHIYSTYS